MVIGNPKGTIRNGESWLGNRSYGDLPMNLVAGRSGVYAQWNFCRDGGLLRFNARESLWLRNSAGMPSLAMFRFGSGSASLERTSIARLRQGDERDEKLNRPIIVVYGPGHEHLKEILKIMHCPGQVIMARDLHELEEILPMAEIVFGWKVPPHLYGKACHLKWVQSMGAGVDDLIANPDLSPTVMITRIVDQFGPIIAEFVFAELLADVRRLDLARQQQSQKIWKPFAVGSLQGQAIGIAGLGSIGRELVRKARVFDMVVYGLSRSAKPGLVDFGFTPAQWPEFVRSLDYLVLTLPATAETQYVVNRTILRAMKPQAIIINVGRGEILRQGDLVDALHQGEIAGAVLDVFETEPLPPEDALWKLPRVRISPHIAGPSLDEQVARFFVANVLRYLHHEPLQGVVDRERGY